MVALDSSVGTARQPILNVPVSLAGYVAAAATLLGLGTMALRGFADVGLRLASEIDWRFASFVFAIAAVVGPLCRLIPFSFCKSLGTHRRQIIWSFCASYGVFLVILLLPNVLGGVTHEDMAAGMTLFSIFGGIIVSVMAYAATPDCALLMGAPVQRALLSVAGAFFWLTYALTGLAHLSGPHRPDAFYGFSLSLMILVLLVRFTDRFVAKLRSA